MTVRNVLPALWTAGLSLLAVCGMLAGCVAEKQQVYATPDYHSWKRTTDVVLDYPIPGHQNRFRIPRMNDVGFTVKPTLDNGKRVWNFPRGYSHRKGSLPDAETRPGRAAHPAHYHG